MASVVQGEPSATSDRAKVTQLAKAELEALPTEDRIFVAEQLPHYERFARKKYVHGELLERHFEVIRATVEAAVGKPDRSRHVGVAALPSRPDSPSLLRRFSDYIDTLGLPALLNRSAGGSPFTNCMACTVSLDVSKLKRADLERLPTRFEDPTSGFLPVVARLCNVTSSPKEIRVSTIGENIVGTNEVYLRPKNPTGELPEISQLEVVPLSSIIKD